MFKNSTALKKIQNFNYLKDYHVCYKFWVLGINFVYDILLTNVMLTQKIQNNSTYNCGFFENSLSSSSTIIERSRTVLRENFSYKVYFVGKAKNNFLCINDLS